MRILILILFISANSYSQYSLYTSIDYVGENNPRQTLDIYIPDGLTQKSPLVIFIHGGGWQSGDTENVLAWCDSLIANDFVVAAINYRFSQDSIFPAQIYDCKAAIRWLKANAEFYLIDTSRIGLIGVSAGAHLASLVGLSADIPDLEDPSQGNSNFNSEVHAVVDFYGPSNLLEMDDYFNTECASPRVYNQEGSELTQLLGCIATNCTDRAIFASPVTYVDASDPPFLIYHGTTDCVVPYTQSTKLYSKLLDNNVNVQLRIVEGVAHGDPVFYNSNSKSEVLNFFSKTLNHLCISCDLFDTDSNDKITAFPNPFNSVTTIRYFLGNEGIVNIRLFNILGEKVKEILNEYRFQGINYSLLHSTNLSSGVYFIIINTPTSILSHKIILAN